MTILYVEMLIMILGRPGPQLVDADLSASVAIADAGGQGVHAQARSSRSRCLCGVVSFEREADHARDGLLTALVIGHCAS